METTIIKPSLELNQLKLQIFWGNLSKELQEKIWRNVSMIIAWSGSSLDLFEILRNQGSSQMLDNTELSSIIDEIQALDSVSQWKIQHQLVDYFISRNLQ